MKFCARCGKKGETKEGLCKECYKIVHPSSLECKDIVVKVCENCNRVFYRNRWSKFHNLKEAVKSIAKDCIKDKRKIEIKPKMGHKPEVNAEIVESMEKFVIPVKIEKIICPFCGKCNGSYFQGVLQLRNIDPKIMKYVLNDLDKKRKEGVFIQKMVDVKNGADIYLTSQKYLQVLGSKLKKRFGGEVKITRKLFTRNKQTGKNVYRLTVLFKA